MAIYDAHSTIFTTTAISPDSYAGDSLQESQLVDMQGFNSLEYIVNIGLTSPSTVGNTFTVELRENDIQDEGSATPVPAQYVLGDASFTGASLFETRRVGYVGKKRFVLVRITPAGNTSSKFGVVSVQGRPIVAATDEN